jgi:peptidoglycan-associated lipoprotein
MATGWQSMNARLAAILCAAAALALLAACSSAPKPSGGVQNESHHLAAQVPSAAPGSEADLKSNVGDRVFFDRDSAQIGPEGVKTLERQADWLKRYPNITVTIEGHCDERGTREYNLALGNRRAHAVKQALAAVGIAAKRVTTISYGKERPAVAGSDEAAWAQNRRAVTVVN